MQTEYDMLNDGGVTFNFASFYFANYTLLTLQVKILKVCLSACVISVDPIGSFAINRSGIVMTTSAKDNYSSMGNPSVSMAVLSWTSMACMSESYSMLLWPYC